jgi:putative ABC transport system permease protein
MIVLRLALMSLGNRRTTAVLTVVAIAISVALVLGVERVRVGARTSFADTISGVDLIVGARSGSIQLLLYSVFRIGNATNNITWTTYQDIAQRPEINWIVPLSLGDSHRGFRVLGTTRGYFEHYRYRRDQNLTPAEGQLFDSVLDTVIGAGVAEALGYKVGDTIVVAHGLGVIETALHDDRPFRVVGILRKTGTPVDRTVHVSLEAIEAIHLNWRDGRPRSKASHPVEALSAAELRPKAVTAALVGLKSRLQVFQLQRFINEYRAEPLSAILPGVALQELWSLVATAETALLAVSAMVVVTAILGMTTMVLATLNERRREMAILRSVGAGPGTIVALMVSEALILTLAGVAAGTAILYGVLFAARPAIDRAYGLHLEIGLPTQVELSALGFVVLAGCLAGLIPARRAYRMSVADGMTVRT